MSNDFQNWCTKYRDAVDGCLQSRFTDAWPQPFQEASLYPLRTGGKRIRPLFTLAAWESVGAEVTAEAIKVASSVELIHTYSLVHDDMPCMDDDSERRGKPATHIAFGEPAALLVGDALLTEAFRTLAHTDLPPSIQIRLVAELAEGAGHVGMIGGQAADIGMGGQVTDINALMKLHNGKTGALIRTAIRMGGIAAGADDDQLDALTEYGAAIGLAFQMADDVLDADEDAGDDGPPSYVKLIGIEKTQIQASQLLQEALDATCQVPYPGHLQSLARFTVERDH